MRSIVAVLLLFSATAFNGVASQSAQSARAVMVQFNVLRYDVDAGGDWDVTVVGRPKIKTLENSRASLRTESASDSYTAEITPHFSPDGTIVLEGSLFAAGQRSTFRRKVAPHTKAILTGVTGAQSLRREAAAGRIPHVKGEPCTVYYLQLVSAEEDTATRQ